jgi:flagellar hook assembly protein FlgD
MKNTWLRQAGVLGFLVCMATTATAQTVPTLPATPSGFTLTAPNGGETIGNAENYSITWTVSGVSGTVEIDLLNSGGTVVSSIADAQTNDGSYTWDTTGLSTGSYLVRVSATSDGAIVDQSDATFSLVVRSVTVTDPNGAEIVNVGDSFTVTWTSSNLSADTVELDLLNSSGSVVAALANATSDDGSYSWNTTGTSAAAYRVRVTSTTYSSATDQSDATFDLASVAVTAPNGGESINGGDSTTITWSSSNLGSDTVELDLLDSGGSLLSSIANAETNDGSYTWSTAGIDAANYLVRVSATTTSAVKDQSDAVFTITPDRPTLPDAPSPNWIQTTAPNGGGTIGISESVTVTWTVSATVSGTIEIDLLNSGGSVVSSIANAETNDGTYTWDTTGLSVGSYLVRVSATSDAAVVDQSDATFSLVTRTVTLTDPNGAEIVNIGDSFTVTWSSSNLSGDTVELDLLDSGGSVVSAIANATSDDGSFSWNTTGATGGSYRVRVMPTTYTYVTDQSDAVFDLASVTVTAPNGGEIVNAGDATTITWSSSNLGSDTVELDLLDSGGSVLSSIADAETNDGTFSWSTGTTTNGTYLIRVSATTTSAVKDQSDATFTLSPDKPTLPTPPTASYLRVTAPNGGETVSIGETVSVTWSSTNLAAGTVEIDLLDSGGSVLSSIADAEADDGAYSWSTVGLSAASYKVRVSKTDASATGQSAATFTAVPTVTITAPNGGEQFRGGANTTITWTSSGVTGTVEFDLLDSGGSVLSSIADAETNDGSYTWNTSGIAKGKYAVRVSSTTSPSVTDNSDANFAIFFSRGLWTSTPVDGEFDGVRSARAADLDGDGDLDVLGGSTSLNDLVWWTNNGTPDGTTWSETTIDAEVGGLRMVHVADVDGDGDLDALATGFSDNEVAWWQNTSGDGSAWTKTSIDASFAGAHAVSTGDMDGDGDLDVLASSFTDNDLVWWVNDGSPAGATWVQRDIETSFSDPVSIMAADVDRDGDLDVVAAGSTADEIAWWENTAGDGTSWTKRSVATAVDGAYAAYPADMDGDGDIDIVGAASVDDEVAWWENTNGSATAWTKRSIASTFDGAEAVWVGDVDGDGDLDVVGAANLGDKIWWWENANGSGTSWTRHRVGAGFDGAHEVSAADIDGDGDLDFLAVAENDDDVMWWENRQAGRSVANGAETTIDSFFDGASDVYAADIDGDGDMDVLGAAGTADDIAWWENTAGDGSAWTEKTIDGSFDAASDVFAADMDGDGDLDVLGAASTADDIAWWENTAGNGSAWTEHTVDGSFDGAFAVYAADIDGDGDVDVLGAAITADDIAWWENTAGDGSAWTKTTIDGTFDNARDVHAADVDGDGDVDVLGAALTADDITWWENTAGDGSAWTEHTIDGSFDGAIHVDAADMDGDGDMDVLGAGRTVAEITWWENTAGTGLTWTEHTVASGYTANWKVLAADMDRDGDMDVLGASGSLDDITWWENTAGTGLAWTEYTVDGSFDNARGVYAADIDGDGDLDVLGAAQSHDDITWWANDTVTRSTGFVITGTDGTGDNVGWRLLAAPCSGQTRADMVGIYITGDDEVTRYDESAGVGTARWLGTPAATALPQGTGFGAYLYDDATQGVDDEFGISFPNCSPTNADVVVSTLDADEEWFLAGNPFMTSFDLSNLSMADFQATVKMWNPTSGSFVDMTQAAGTDDVIRVGQGFFVQRTTVGSGATSITFDDAGKTSGGAFVGKGGDPFGTLGLTLTVRGSDGEVLAFDEAATILVATDAKPGWDRYASSKLRPLREDFATVAFVIDRDGKPHVLSRLSVPAHLSEAVTIPLQIDAALVTGRGTLAWPEWSGIPEDWRIELVDLDTGFGQDIRHSKDYAFSVAPAKKSPGQSMASGMKAQGAPRFALVITPASTTATDELGVPLEYALLQNYPNPFNPATLIRYALPESGPVRLKVYDVLGREVVTLVDTRLAAGWHEARFDASILSSGLYVYRLMTERGTLSRTMHLVR